MAAIKGKPFLFTVVGFNAEGDTLPLTNATVSSNNGTATVNPDGSGGTDTPVTLGVGALVLTATAGGFTATLTEDVNPDPTLASIKIIPS